MIDRMMKRIVAMGLVGAALLSAQPATVEEKPAASEPATATNAAKEDETKGVIEAMAAIGSIIAGADKTEETTAAAPAEPGSQSVTKPTETTVGQQQQKGAAPDQAAAKKPRDVKQSIALITGGAAAGAAVGAAMGKGSKGAMVGAALGGVAGLIYDRMTYRNPGKL